jgi:hypothetical protein
VGKPLLRACFDGYRFMVDREKIKCQLSFQAKAHAAMLSSWLYVYNCKGLVDELLGKGGKEEIVCTVTSLG